MGDASSTTYELHSSHALMVEPTTDARPGEDPCTFRSTSKNSWTRSGSNILKDLPLSVISELTQGMALRLALQVNAGQLSLDEATLTEMAKACWDAIAR